MEHVQQEPVGCIVYDDAACMDSGWYARDEEMAVRKLAGRELPHCALWLSNMSYELGESLVLPENITTEGYLREPLTVFAQRQHISDSRVLAQCGARFLSRVLRLGRCFLGLASFVPARSLRCGIQNALGKSEMLVDAALAKIIQEATVTYTGCQVSGKPEKGRERLTLIAEPRQHCLEILEQTLPYGRLRPLQASQMPNEDATRADLEAFVHSLKEQPGFFQISCFDIDEPWKHLLTFGQERGVRLGRGRRIWVSWPEMSFLVTRAELCLHAALVPASSKRLLWPKALAEFFPSASMLSPSCGIFFENVWNALALQARPKAAFSGSLVAVNACTPFFRAMDRILLCKQALALQANGLSVLGYANGRIHVEACAPETMFAAALKAGCIPSYLALPDTVTLSETSPYALHALWSAQGSLTKLLKADWLIVQNIVAHGVHTKQASAMEA